MPIERNQADDTQEQKDAVWAFDVLEEIVDEWQSRIEEGEAVDFPEVLEDYFGNLLDDMHDARGDRDYQLGQVDRMRTVTKWVASIHDMVVRNEEEITQDLTEEGE